MACRRWDRRPFDGSLRLVSVGIHTCYVRYGVC